MVALTTCLECCNSKEAFVCFSFKIGNILANLYAQVEELTLDKKRDYFCTEMAVKDWDGNT